MLVVLYHTKDLWLLDKIKTLFKIFIVSILILVILFGIYRREYLSQAIPVYIQYLEQRAKWENINTGTYTYYSPTMYTYYFIKDNRLEKVMRHGNPYDPQFVKNFKDSHLYKIRKKHKDLHCYLENKEYLVGKRFDAVRRLILIAGFVGKYASIRKYDFDFNFADLLTENNNKYSYGVGYNKKYGYPMFVTNMLTRYISQGESRLQYLIMLPKGIQYTNKVLKKILDYYGYKEIMLDNHKMNRIPIVDTVGGNLIKSGIFDTNETFRLNKK